MPAITKRAKEIARLERAADEGRVKVEAIIWIDRAVGARAGWDKLGTRWYFRVWHDDRIVLDTSTTRANVAAGWLADMHADGAAIH